MLPQQSSTILISHVNVTLGTDKTSKSQHIPNSELLPRFGPTFMKSVVILFNFSKMIFLLTAGQGRESNITSQHPEMFYVFLTVNLAIIPVNNQLDAQFFSVYVYLDTLHVSSNHVLIIRRINCIKTSGICHSM